MGARPFSKSRAPSPRPRLWRRLWEKDVISPFLAVPNLYLSGGALTANLGLALCSTEASYLDRCLFLKEKGRRHLKPLTKLFDVPLVEFPLPTQNFRDDAF